MRRSGVRSSSAPPITPKALMRHRNSPGSGGIPRGVTPPCRTRRRPNRLHPLQNPPFQPAQRVAHPCRPSGVPRGCGCGEPCGSSGPATTPTPSGRPGGWPSRLKACSTRLAGASEATRSTPRATGPARRRQPLRWRLTPSCPSPRVRPSTSTWICWPAASPKNSTPPNQSPRRRWCPPSPPGQSPSNRSTTPTWPIPASSGPARPSWLTRRCSAC